MKTEMTRRFFLGGFASFGAFAGCRLFADSTETFSSGVPNLRFGVVSDIHIRYFGKGKGYGSTEMFQRTLEWYRDQGVDAVMIVGDMADLGMVDQLEAVARAWYEVFPDDKAPDGRRVEKLFVCGNHDFHGYLYGNNYAEQKYPDEKERAKHVLRADIPGNWRRIFREDYAPFYRKEIKGYTFLGQNWDDGTDMSGGWGKHSCFGIALKDFLDRKGASLDPAKPFFYFQHPHPKDTCYGSWAWGHDKGLSTAALSAFPNAIAFSGHSHYTLTDERSIWQGTFTSVGTSSLRYIGMPYDWRGPLGYENSGAPDGKRRDELNALKVMSNAENWSCQGMLWSVYADRIVIRRREFQVGLDLGADWVMPLPTAEPKPFAFAARAKKAVAPEFAADAKLTLKRVAAKTREVGKIASVAKDAIQIEIPQALAVKSSRPMEYEVTAIAEGGTKELFRVLPEGFCHSLEHARTKQVTNFRVSIDRLPLGTRRFEVRPVDCWDKRGKPLAIAL